MNILQIKEELGVKQLDFRAATDADGVVNKDWYNHWINEPRAMVSIAKDTIDNLEQHGAELKSLALQEETAKGEKGDYTRYRIVQHTPADYSY